MTIRSVVASLVMFTTGQCAAADMLWSHDAQGRPFVAFAGEIVDGDTARLVLGLSHKHERHVPYLLVDSPGGASWEGLRLAHLIRRTGMAVAVGRGECASACVSLLAGARQRFTSKASAVGVHRSAYGDDDKRVETKRSDQMTIDTAALYKGWGVPLDVIGAMAVTGSERIYRLTAAQRAEFTTVTPDGLPPATWTGAVAHAVGTTPTDDELEHEVSVARPHQGTEDPQGIVVREPRRVEEPEPERDGHGGTFALGLLAVVVLYLTRRRNVG